MVLVLLGTQDKPFTRLLDAIQREMDNGNIKEEVIVQAGCTQYHSKKMKIFDLIAREELIKLEEKADLIITHGGVGTIIECLQKNKKIIAAARLKEYGEHVNDHQIQIIENFNDLGYLLELKDFDDLNKLLKKAKSFKPKKYESNTRNMINLIENYIDKL
jgi:UDP-N-acetylglucosamine transferase subunit ALG13